MEPIEAVEKYGPSDNAIVFPFPSDNKSVIDTPESGAFPVFSTVILNLIISPTSILPLPQYAPFNQMVPRDSWRR